VGVGNRRQAGCCRPNAALIRGVKQAGVPRLLVVGGAGSLEVRQAAAGGAPGFPEAYKAPALAHRECWSCTAWRTLDWTNLSPAAMIAPGKRTGEVRLGGDQLIRRAKGRQPHLRRGLCQWR